MLVRMKLSRLYSDKLAQFAPIDFVAGLNVVIAEIRVPENRQKDTHNLGKTTLGRLLDFGFLSGRNANFFLFKHLDLYPDSPETRKNPLPTAADGILLAK